MPEYIFPLHCSRPEHDPADPISRSITTAWVMEDLPEIRTTALKFANLKVCRDNPLCPECRGHLTIRQDLSDLIYR